MGKYLGLSSILYFDCKKCGACCGEGLEIYLNSLDVWNLRSRFREPTGYIIDKYLILERRPEYGSYPLCLIRNREGRCPFHDGRLCSVHPWRPASCRLFPVTHIYGADRESLFALTGDFDFCKGGEGAPPATLEKWLAVNSIADFDKIIEIQKGLAPLFRSRLGEPEMQSLFRILFDFDSAAGFPFGGNYAEDRRSAAEALEWIERETVRFMAGIIKS